MLRLVLETAALTGFVIVGIHQVSDITKIPLPAVGLVGVLLRHFALAPDYVMFWSAYALLVYHLVSFHDFDTCILEPCSVDKMYAYILLGSTFVFWMVTGETKAKTVKVEDVPRIRMTPVAPPVQKKPSRLKMGDPVQSRWV